MNEQSLKLKVMKFIKQKFPDAICWKLADKFNSGRPDLLIIFPTKYLIDYPLGVKTSALCLFIELKNKGKKLRPLQRWVMDEINRAGGHAYSTDSMEEMAYIISRYAKMKGGKANGEAES